MELDVRYFHKMKRLFAVNQIVYARGRSSVEKCLAGRLCFCQNFVSSAVLSHKKMSTVEGGANRTSSSVSQGHLSGKSFQDYPRICPIHLCRYSFFCIVIQAGSHAPTGTQPYLESIPSTEHPLLVMPSVHGETILVHTLDIGIDLTVVCHL